MSFVKKTWVENDPITAAELTRVEEGVRKAHDQEISVDGAQIATGLLPDARLSANVARRNAANTFNNNLFIADGDEVRLLVVSRSGGHGGSLQAFVAHQGDERVPTIGKGDGNTLRFRDNALHYRESGVDRDVWHDGNAPVKARASLASQLGASGHVYVAGGSTNDPGAWVVPSGWTAVAHSTQTNTVRVTHGFNTTAYHVLVTPIVGVGDEQIIVPQVAKASTYFDVKTTILQLDNSRQSFPAPVDVLVIRR